MAWFDDFSWLSHGIGQSFFLIQIGLRALSSVVERLLHTHKKQLFSRTPQFLVESQSSSFHRWIYKISVLSRSRTFSHNLTSEVTQEVTFFKTVLKASVPSFFVTSSSKSHSMNVLRQDRSEFNVLILPPELEDLMLDQYEFRIYAHLVRQTRGTNRTNRSINSMSATCRIYKDTVLRALKSLEQRGMIKIIKRPGKPSVYVLTPTSEWIRL